MIPFTKLAHCVLAPLSQAVTAVAWKFPPGAGDRVAATLGYADRPSWVPGARLAAPRIRERRGIRPMKAAILTDTTKCIGCHECEFACKKENHLEADVPRKWDRDDGLSARNWTSIVEGPAHALCASSAATAWSRPARRPVRWARCIRPRPAPWSTTAAKCMGCRYCMMACPYGIPRYDWDRPVPYVRKCILCYDADRTGPPARLHRGVPRQGHYFRRPRRTAGRSSPPHRGQSQAATSTRCGANTRPAALPFC